MDVGCRRARLQRDDGAWTFLMNMDLLTASGFTFMVFSVALALFAVFSPRKNANVTCGISVIFLAVQCAILGAQFVAAVLIVCAISVMMASCFYEEDSDEMSTKENAPAFTAALAAIVISFFVVILLLVIFRRPFISVPLSGVAFESSDAIGLILISRYPVALAALATGALVVALVSAAMCRMNCEGENISAKKTKEEVNEEIR